MTRPSKNIDKVLIAAAKVMIARDGFEAFSVRALCAEANVNLGMFFYYFKTKENFVKIVFNDAVAELENGIIAKLNKTTEPLEKLKAVILNVAETVENKKHLMFIFFKVAATKEKYINDLIEEHEKKQFAFFSGIIRQLQEKQIVSKNIDMRYMLPVVYGSVMHAVFAKNMLAKRDEDYGVYLAQLADFVIKLLK